MLRSLVGSEMCIRDSDNGDPPVGNSHARSGNPSSTGRSQIDLGSYIEPAHPGEDKFPSPHQKPFHISRNPTTRGRKRRFPGSIPPYRVWKPQHHWAIADWLRLMAPTRGESCPQGQRRGPGAPGENNFPSPDQKSIHISTCLLYTSPSPRDS